MQAFVKLNYKLINIILMKLLQKRGTHLTQRKRELLAGAGEIFSAASEVLCYYFLGNADIVFRWFTMKGRRSPVDTWKLSFLSKV